MKMKLTKFFDSRARVPFRHRSGVKIFLLSTTADSDNREMSVKMKINFQKYFRNDNGEAALRTFPLDESHITAERVWWNIFRQQ